jgi:hypothetical protein
MGATPRSGPRGVNRPLASYAHKVLVEGWTGRPVEGPVFLWEDGVGFEAADEASAETDVSWVDAPRTGAPLVLEVPPLPGGIGGLILGRTDANDIIVPHPSVSRLHAVLHYEPHGRSWSVTDAGSRNGTVVDGRVIPHMRSAQLPDRALLRVGGVQLRFLLATTFWAELIRRLQG